MAVPPPDYKGPVMEGGAQPTAHGPRDPFRETCALSARITWSQNRAAPLTVARAGRVGRGSRPHGRSPNKGSLIQLIRFRLPFERPHRSDFVRSGVRARSVARPAARWARRPPPRDRARSSDRFAPNGRGGQRHGPGGKLELIREIEEQGAKERKGGKIWTGTRDTKLLKEVDKEISPESLIFTNWHAPWQGKWKTNLQINQYFLKESSNKESERFTRGVDQGRWGESARR